MNRAGTWARTCVDCAAPYSVPAGSQRPRCERCRILHIVRVVNGGPRARTVLEGLVGEDLIAAMIADGSLARYGGRKGATWGLPRRRRRA